MAFEIVVRTEADRKVIILIDHMLKSLGPNGERWMKGEERDYHGNMCFIGALNDARGKLGIAGVRFNNCFVKAMRLSGLSYKVMADFNDCRLTKFTHIRGLLLLMRQIAQGIEPAISRSNEQKPRFDLIEEGQHILANFSRERLRRDPEPSLLLPTPLDNPPLQALAEPESTENSAVLVKARGNRIEQTLRAVNSVNALWRGGG